VITDTDLTPAERWNALHPRERDALLFEAEVDKATTQKQGPVGQAYKKREAKLLNRVAARAEMRKAVAKAFKRGITAAEQASAIVPELTSGRTTRDRKHQVIRTVNRTDRNKNRPLSRKKAKAALRASLAKWKGTRKGDEPPPKRPRREESPPPLPPPLPPPPPGKGATKQPPPSAEALNLQPGKVADASTPTPPEGAKNGSEAPPPPPPEGDKTGKPQTKNIRHFGIALYGHCEWLLETKTEQQKESSLFSNDSIAAGSLELLWRIGGDSVVIQKSSTTGLLVHTLVEPTWREKWESRTGQYMYKDI
jgi:hypothetical protein